MKNILLKLQSFLISILFIGFIQFSKETKAQDAYFSQYNNSPLTVNPALTGGFNGSVSISANYRDQWRSVYTPYKTFAFAADMGVFRKSPSSGFLGAGISVISDKAGVSQLGLNQVSLSLAYHVQISTNNAISVGLQGGFAQRSININYDKLKWDNQFNGVTYDPNLSSLESARSNSLTYGDYATGIQWTFSTKKNYSNVKNQINFNAGISFFHVNQPNISFYTLSKDKLPTKMVIHASSFIGFENSKSSIIPTFIYINQTPFTNMTAGIFLRYKSGEESKYTDIVKGNAVSLGFHYRFKEAVIPSLQLETANYTVGVSYDISIAGIKTITSGNGGFEVSLKIGSPNPFTSKSVSTSTPKLISKKLRNLVIRHF